MAQTPKNAQELIESIWKKAKIKAKKEVDELKEYF
jgi:Zn-dependent oligopeptidase